MIAVSGAVATYLFGGWSALLGILLAFVAFDYLTGVLASAADGELSSTVGLIGIAKKVAIFTLVAVMHLVDTAIGDAHLFRDATIFFYLANELLSILENTGRLGIPLPDVVQDAVKALKGQVKKS